MANDTAFVRGSVMRSTRKEGSFANDAGQSVAYGYDTLTVLLDGAVGTADVRVKEGSAVPIQGEGVDLLCEVQSGKLREVQRFAYTEPMPRKHTA